MSLNFLFVQFEFTHAVGPHAARYVVDQAVLERLPGASSATAGTPREAAPEDPALDTRNRELAGVSRGVGGSDVLVVGVVAAPASRPRLLRRARQAAAQTGPAEVPLSLVTYVKGTRPFAQANEAAGLLDVIRRSEPQQQLWVDEGLAVLNLAIRAHRAGAPDPYAIEVTRRDPRQTRIGYGTTEEVQDGLWRDAIELPPPAGARAGRIERLRPAEAVAAVLAGGRELLDGEDLLLRALVDLDQGRTRAAAYQAAAAMGLTCDELSGTPDTEELAGRAEQAEQLAHAASQGGLSEAQVSELEGIVEWTLGRLDLLRQSVSIPRGK